MKTHSEIVKSAGGATKFTERLNAAGFDFARGTVQQWASRNSIPDHYWRQIIDAGLATESELINASALKRQAA